MCRAVTCNSCGKPTWAGCGAHIEQVLGHLPEADRCQCREKAAKGEKTEAASGSGGSLLGRIFGGR